MTYIILIITGFLQVAIGLCIWCHTHQINKHTIYEVVDTEGQLVSDNHFFDRFRIRKYGIMKKYSTGKSSYTEGYSYAANLLLSRKATIKVLTNFIGIQSAIRTFKFHCGGENV